MTRDLEMGWARPRHFRWIRAGEHEMESLAPSVSWTALRCTECTTRLEQEKAQSRYSVMSSNCNLMTDRWGLQKGCSYPLERPEQGNKTHALLIHFPGPITQAPRNYLSPIPFSTSASWT